MSPPQPPAADPEPAASLRADSVDESPVDEQLMRTLLLDVQRQAEELSLLDQVRSALAREMELDVIIHTVVEAMAQTFGYTHVSLHLLEEGALVCQHQVGYPQRISRIPIAQGIKGRVARTAQPVLVADVRAEPDHVAFAEGIISEVSVPLFDQGAVVGTLSVASTTRVLNETDLRLVRALGEHVNVAITRARLFREVRDSEEELRRRAQQLTAIHETSLDITAPHGLPTVLNKIVERATHLLDCTSGGLYLCDSLRREVRCVVSYNTMLNYEGVTLRYGEGPAGRVAESGKPLQVDRDAQGPEADALFADDLPFAAVLHVPMTWQGQVIGVLAVNSRERELTAGDLMLLSLFADHAAIAVENARLLDEVRRLAYTDELTGISNRRQFFQLGEREFARAQRYGRPLAALMLDIDQFKRVNDAHGHALGDQVLRAVAQHCVANIRAFDIVGRYGGEEFAILLPDTEPPGALQVAERLRQSIESGAIATAHGDLHVTVSAGIASLDAGTRDLPSLLDAADQALYVAKQSGRNRVEIWAVEK